MKKRMYRRALGAICIASLAPAGAQANTFTSTTSVVDNDTWNQGGNWDLGSPPSGTDSATISSALTATVNVAGTLAYSGGLTLESDSELDVRNVADAPNAIGTGAVTLNSNSILRIRTGGTLTIANNLIFAGDASLENSSNTTDNKQRFLDGDISGSGLFTYGMRRGNLLALSGTNTWDGGFVANFTDSNFNNASRVRPDINGAFGGGDVTCNDGIKLEIPAGLGNTIADTATLTLNGRGRPSTEKLQLGSNEAVGKLVLDGFPYPGDPTTYGEPGSGADIELDALVGSGILTVNSEPTDNTPPTATIAGVTAGGSPTDVYATEPVSYTITFSEPHTPELTAGDLENSTGTSIAIESFAVMPNPVAGPTEYQVVVKATEPGTLNLRIKSGTAIKDLFGNDLGVPVTDDDTFTVDPLPDLQGALGLWKPWANGRINPATSNPWAVGDTYRLAFCSANTVRDATSLNITDYDDALTAYANTAGLGGDWFCIGATDTSNGRTSTGMTATGVAILQTDGATVIAESYDAFWDGSLDAPIIRDENGNVLADVGPGTGMNSNGTPRDRHLGGSDEGDPPGSNAKITKGRNTSASGQWAVVYNGAATSQWHFYAISDVLALQGTGGGVPHITAIAVDGSGNVILTLDGSAAGLTAQQSNDLTTGSFADVTSTPGANTLTIDSSLVDPDGDGADYYRVRN